MTSSVHAMQRKVDIALALAGKLIPADVYESLENLTLTKSYRMLKAHRAEALERSRGAIYLAQQEGRRTESLQAFRALLLEGVFIDSMAVLAVESRIAEFKERHQLPAPATVSESEQP